MEQAEVFEHGWLELSFTSAPPTVSFGQSRGTKTSLHFEVAGGPSTDLMEGKLEGLADYAQGSPLHRRAHFVGELGTLGWELVAVDGNTWYFKRRLT